MCESCSLTVNSKAKLSVRNASKARRKQPPATGSSAGKQTPLKEAQDIRGCMYL